MGSLGSEAPEQVSESEARFRLLLGTVAQAIWETDAAGVVVTDSPSWRAYTGQTVEAWLGYGWLDVIHPDDRAFAERQWREAMAAQRPVNAEFRLRAPDGRWRWTNLLAAPVRDADGAIQKWAGINIDIDARRRAEIALREREADLARAQRIGGVGGLNIDVAAGLTSTRSPEFLRLHGLGPESLHETHADWRARVHPDDVDAAERRLFAVLEGTSTMYDSEYRIIRPSDGRTRWIHARVDIERDAEGKAIRMIGAHLDVTDQKQVQAELRESEARYRALFVSLDQAYAVVEVLKDDDGRWCDFRFVDANPAFMRHTGMPYPVGKTATELLGSPNPNWTRFYGEVLDTGKPMRIEESENTLGRTFDLNIFGVEQGRNRVAVLFSDITERKRAERALNESERRLKTLVQGVPQIVWRAVDGGQWTWASPQWTEFTGQPEHDSHGYGWLDPVHPDDRKAVCDIWERAVERGEFHADYRVCDVRQGRYRWFQTRATPVRDERGDIVEWLGTSTDVDDLRRLQHRQEVLLAELQHRVRNILAVTRSIISRSDDGERSTEDYVAHLQGRISALARTQVLLTRAAGTDVDLELLIRDEIVAQAVSEDQVDISGQQVAISPKSAEVLTLAIHELATNATKYGAFSRPSGRLQVSWHVEAREGRRWLVIYWREHGVPILDAAPRREGFGAELIRRRIPYELKGHGSFELTPGGVESCIEFPLVHGESILQTDTGGR